MFAFPALDLIRPFPYVVHFHGPWAAEARAEGAGRGSVLYKRAMETAVYRSADRFVVLSEAFGACPHERLRRARGPGAGRPRRR